MKKSCLTVHRSLLDCATVFFFFREIYTPYSETYNMLLMKNRLARALADAKSLMAYIE